MGTNKYLSVSNKQIFSLGVWIRKSTEIGYDTNKSIRANTLAETVDASSNMHTKHWEHSIWMWGF